jgi:hypothetical protein
MELCLFQRAVGDAIIMNEFYRGNLNIIKYVNLVTAEYIDCFTGKKVKW